VLGAGALGKLCLSRLAFVDATCFRSPGEVPVRVGCRRFGTISKLFFVLSTTCCHVTNSSLRSVAFSICGFPENKDNMTLLRLFNLAIFGALLTLSKKVATIPVNQRDL